MPTVLTTGAVDGVLAAALAVPAPKARTWFASHMLWVTVTAINWLVVLMVAPATLVYMMPSALTLNAAVSGSDE